MKHLGTQQYKTFLYDYHADDSGLHVYQTRRELGNSSKPVWFHQGKFYRPGGSTED